VALRLGGQQVDELPWLVTAVHEDPGAVLALQLSGASTVPASSRRRAARAVQPVVGLRIPAGLSMTVAATSSLRAGRQCMNTAPGRLWL
jgi:hypothetical protein